MIKEELKQEAEEWLCNNLHSASEEDFIKAMVDIAEPREKRIAELEKENANLMVLRKYELNVAKLEKENKALIKAKELLKWALHSDPEHDEDFDQKWEEAEQFLKQE